MENRLEEGKSGSQESREEVAGVTVRGDNGWKLSVGTGEGTAGVAQWKREWPAEITVKDEGREDSNHDSCVWGVSNLEVGGKKIRRYFLDI